ATLKLAAQFDPENRIDLDVDSALPDTLKDFDKISARGTIDVFTPDLVALSLPADVIGDLTMHTDFRVENKKLSAQAVLDSSNLAFSGAELSGTHVRIDIEKDFEQEPDAPVFAKLVSRLEGGVKSLRFQDYLTDSLDVLLSSRNESVLLERLTLAKGSNSLRLKANYSLPADLSSWEREPLDFDLAVEAPDLSAFVVPDSGANLKGTLRITGQGTSRDRTYKGDFVITGRDMEVQGLPIRSIDGRLEAAEGQARLQQFDLVFNDKNTLHGSATMHLAEPFDYRGSLDVQLADLSIFQVLLEQEAIAPALGGSLRLTWEGDGDFRAAQHNGNATVDLTAGQYGDLKDLTAHAAASYSPQFINIPDLRLTAGKYGQALLSLFWKENRLSLFNFSVHQNKLTLIEGSAELPLHLSEAQHPDRLIPNNEALKLALRSKDLDLRALFNQFGEQKPPITGVINLDVNAQGTLDELVAKATLRGAQLKSPDAAQLDPASVSLDL
ncbi:MAG TPA: hypothetical protein VIT23_11910, partial [Terrimicrobiaceae bacterium]